MSRSEPTPPLRSVQDPRSLRALAHPTRMALLEALALHGTLTATEAAALVGGNASNASYHLRTLASHGYVTQAEGGAGRERPWRLDGVGMTFEQDDEDPGVAQAASALSEVLSERWAERRRRFQLTREQYPEAVRRAAGESQAILFVTPEEMEQVKDELLAVVMRYYDRIEDRGARPEGSLPFEVVMSAVPFTLGEPEPSPES
ncbi:ArsR/SmtB family transcription factor [Streptacidiphilus jiangxiensis]|uniref:Helix-turn-helix domain-containing protein n=1 Tax=Streptacidiphilus jiangxiensis TaxID=235985 RepID=A0A1H7LCP8_STRJI|nr:helix-turn-helix domain-containing protein [Streptacidiphilus jiangxiensis]SEK96325.1 Helix-turn-helix domain-containing protein [Streptacidiphilus jiangxiensis]